MNIYKCFKLIVLSITIMTVAVQGVAVDWEELPTFVSPIGDKVEPMQTGQFEPTWKSLREYECPEWFRNAKFGIWAHWGAQCQPQRSDWYARGMYEEGHWQYKSHLETYGHPSKFGFKDIIHEWKAENWDPEKLVALYKRAGAQYFMALANHHDNFDNYDSAYQPWNSVNMGPKKDLIAGWAKAARDNGLRFGVSVHAAHAWSWYEVAQGADKTGEYAGIPYDGKLTKADGKGQWWEGLDPQDLYEQKHTPSTTRNVHDLWDWEADKGCSIPDIAYCEKFYNRTVDLINKYQPDLIYFDDTILPLYPVSDAGLKLAAHYYNSSMKWHDGKLEAVMNGKKLSPEQRQCMVWDIERGQSNRIEPYPWQTCTCIGSWHYDQGIFDRHGYKSAKTVVQTLVDVVSKNGNLLLSVPVRADGTLDSDEVKILEDIAEWMDVNKECIFGTRPWKVFGEGPVSESAAPIKAQGFNEGKSSFTADDIRFTARGDTLYAIVMGWPTKPLQIKTLGTDADLLSKSITNIQLLGSHEKIQWEQNEQALTIEIPRTQPCDAAVVFKITAQ